MASYKNFCIKETEKIKILWKIKVSLFSFCSIQSIQNVYEIFRNITPEIIKQKEREKGIGDHCSQNTSSNRGL